MTNDEFIQVPVPRQYVTKVYELVARLDADGTPEAEASGRDDREDGVLTQALVWRIYRESEDPHKRLLEFLADHPDQWLSSQAVADGLGLEHGRRSLAGSLGAFGRRAEHRYSGQKPFESLWDGETYQSRLRMSQEVAAWIEEAAAS
jgi:hypothetical protein